MQITKRHLSIRLPKGRSAFLWGPRRVGKAYWIHHHFLTGEEMLVDLLESDTFAEYASRPALLRERWNGRLTVIDDAQKIPALLDTRDRRMIQTEKFYLFDVGIANHLARRRPRIGSPDFGKSFEHWVLMEKEPRVTGSGIRVLPWRHFLDELWAGVLV